MRKTTASTHDSLRQMELKKGGTDGGRRELDINLPPSPEWRITGVDGGAGTVERGLLGGIGRYGVTHVKSELTTSDGMEMPSWPSGDGGVAGGAGVATGSGGNGSGLTLWEDNHTIKENRQHMWWPSPYAAPSSDSSLGTPNSSRNVYMEEEEPGKGYGSFLKDLTAIADGKSNRDGPKDTIPRSKHCTTEQRRRDRINDRFRILRDLVPPTNQKRDRASFLLEVIEYIQSLHEKVVKYESEHQGWDDGNLETVPWVKFLLRSFWEHSQNDSQKLSEAVAEPSHCRKESPIPPGFLTSASNGVASVPALVETNERRQEPQHLTSRLTSESTKVSVSSHSEYTENHESQKHCSRDKSVTSGDAVRGQELEIDQGMIIMSSAYSQGLVNGLTVALRNSGVDMSQANISVQINLRGTKPPIPEKNQEDGSRANEQSRVGGWEGAASRQPCKRQRTGKIDDGSLHY